MPIKVLSFVVTVYFMHSLHMLEDSLFLVLCQVVKVNNLDPNTLILKILSLVKPFIFDPHGSGPSFEHKKVG